MGKAIAEPRSHRGRGLQPRFEKPQALVHHDIKTAPAPTPLVGQCEKTSEGQNSEPRQTPQPDPARGA